MLAGVAGAGAAMLSACSSGSATTGGDGTTGATTTSDTAATSDAGTAAATVATGTTAAATAAGGAREAKPLMVFFSRPGENYFNGRRIDLEVGHTKVMAQTIADLIDVDLHEIVAAQPYSSDYSDTVARNVREQEERARPAIAGPLPSLAGRETVLLGSPIWNVQSPRIMRTFVDSVDWAGIRVVPFTTHAMSGLGGAMEEYREACRGASLAGGLAVRGEQVRESRPQIEAWLRRANILQ